MTKQFMRTAYDPSGHLQPEGENEWQNPDRDEYGNPIPGTEMPSMTEQHHAEHVDINNIMARHQASGVVDHVTKYQQQYGEHTGQDFYSAMALITKANSMFMELPSSARDNFDNDPAKFLDFVDKYDIDHDNPRTILDLGIVEENSPTFQKLVARLSPAEPGTTDQNNNNPTQTPDPKSEST